MSSSAVFNLSPLGLADLPDPTTDAFQGFLDDHFAAGEQLIDTMEEWCKHSTPHHGTVQVVTLPSSSSYAKIRKLLEIKEFWCGRISHHTTDNVRAHKEEHKALLSSTTFSPATLVRSISDRLTRRVGSEATVSANDAKRHSKDLSEVERQERVMTTAPEGLYERFRRGLLEYHSENEREYIESCRETECLQVLQPHVAEIWRLTYVTPPPTSPRTFVVLLLSRELNSAPMGERSFMNISIPFSHPDCPEKNGGEKSRVRGKYVSVERVKETDRGMRVEWKMATSSDAGGNIPRFVTNASLPSKISEDVPSFLSWMVKRFPEGGNVASRPVTPHS